MDHFDKPLGGTELMYNELMRRLPNRYKEEFSIFNYPNGADFSKKKIYWNQLSYDQDAIQFLKEKQNIDNIDHFVFVSNWQAEKFRQIYNIPGEKTSVIKNAHLGISEESDIKMPYGVDTQNGPNKSDRIIKICYTSTPWRGLDVLLKAWEMLNPINCELHVFSSCKIYGKDFAQEDSKYEFLYDWCERLPNVIYHGSIPNPELRKKLTQFEILAYPNTFEETSCITVIEAISAGLRVVTSSLGALPETTEGNATIYSYVDDRNKHSEVFAEVLGEEIKKVRKGYYKEKIEYQRQYYRREWSWDERMKDWESLLNRLSSKSNFMFRNSWDAQIFDEVYNKNEYKIESFKREDIVIDIGSHIGSFTKLAIDKGSENVYSYEADKDNYSLSMKNLSDYDKNMNNCAVWRSDIDSDTIPFIIDKSDANTGLGTIMSLDKNNDSVDSISLDDILSKFKKIRFLKIDVEGSEFPIILTSKLIGRIEEIVGEFHEYEGEEFNSLPNHCIVSGYKKYTRKELIDFLEKMGFYVEIEEVNWSNKHGFLRARKANI